MDIDGDLFAKESSTAELIPRGVDDMLFDTSDDLHKTLFASLDSIIVPLSPRPVPRDVANKIDNDVPSSDELDGTSTFTSPSTAGNNGHLVGSHELGLSIQQETPQLLMEGDTLDDNIIQALSPYEQEIIEMLIPAAADTTHERTNELPMKVDSKGISLPVVASSQSTDSVIAPLDSVILSNLCMGTSGNVTASTPVPHVSSPVSSPVAHVSSSVAVTSSPSVTNQNSLLDHVSSPLVTMNSSTCTASASYPPNTISYALTLLAGAPYSMINSSPLSLNELVTNEVSSIVLPSSSPSSMLSSTSSSMLSSTSSSNHHHDNTSNRVNISSHNLENDDGDNCWDDIIGQSLMLAHNAVHSSPNQLLASHDPPCQESPEQLPVCIPVDNHSHDQQMDCGVTCSVSHDATNKTCGTSGVTKSTTTITSKIPSKITFIDWTEIKRKNVTPLYYPSTPTPINVILNQDDAIPAPSSKKKKINTKSTGKRRGWVKGRPRKTPAFNSIIKQMPKSPRSGYMYYLSDFRSEVVKDNPNLSMGEVSNYLGKKWSQLPAEQRESYLNKGYMDRQRYIKELVAYYQQKNNDFQQQDPTFDPEWATKYLTQYINNNSDDVLYCPVCDVQFSSLHNKQQHCLSRKHNREVVTFVQKSVKKHQKKNGNVSTSVNHPANINSENSSKNLPDYMISSRDHLTNPVVPTVDHSDGTEDSIADHTSNNVDHVSNAEDHMSNTEDHMSINVDHISNTEDHMRMTKNHTSNAEDHMSCAEHHVSSAEDHIGGTEDSIANENCHTSDPDHCVVLTSRENSLRSDTLGDTNPCSSNTTTAKDHMILTDSHACSSVDHSNNDVSVKEGSCDQPFVSFPPYYGLNNMIYDFTLHQQGMLNSLSEANSLLHSRHAQLQGDSNELEAQVEDMEKQLQCSRQENIGLLSQLETLSHMIHSIGQEDNA